MAPLEPLPGVRLATLRARKLEATQRLLGATIAVCDDDWQQLTRLPGWTRAHLASHIARNADALRRLAEGVHGGSPAPRSGAARGEEIERGSERNALDLQIDLDTSAGRLNETFDRLTDEQWHQPVTLRDGQTVPLSWLPLSRLFEVEIHHVDLGLGHTIDRIDEETATWLLRWAARRVHHCDNHRVPQARLHLPDGTMLPLGAGTGPDVTGTPQGLLGWLTGRASGHAVQGAEAPGLLAL